MKCKISVVDKNDVVERLNFRSALMRIGILTLPLHTNYGGLLQAYALQTVLEQMGHNVVVLDKMPCQHLPLMKMILLYAKRLVKKYIFRKEEMIFKEKYYNRSYSIVSQHTKVFIDKYIHRLEVSNLSDLSVDDYDAFVVGSDQIWRPKYYPQIYNAFLAFTEKWQVKRLAYAPSFGTNKWEYTAKQTKRCAALVKKFDLVTVREDSGVALCRNYFGVEAKHVLDPTMLLERQEYENLLKNGEYNPNSGNLLVYVLDFNQQIESIIQEVSACKELKPFYTSSKVENIMAPIEQRIQKPVEAWISGFINAEFVITDSFHACVFSIIFNKPFVVLGNNERGMSRFISLLTMFSLENRLVTSLDEIMQLPEVDWLKVNDKLNKIKEVCLEMLNQSLE